jgi:hypothetical protein
MEIQVVAREGELKEPEYMGRTHRHFAISFKNG